MLVVPRCEDKFAAAAAFAGSSWRANLPQILKRIDAAAVLIRPVDAQRVISHQFGRLHAQRLGIIAGQDGEPRFFGRGGSALPDLLALGARAQGTQIIQTVYAASPVLPVDFQLLVF